MWNAVLTVHLLAMAFFVGGQLFIAAAVLPAERRAPDRERMRAVARNFGYGSLVALVVLAGTGAAMASHQHLWSSPTLHAKLGVIGLLIVLGIVHIRLPRAWPIDVAILACSIAVVALGVVLAG